MNILIEASGSMTAGYLIKAIKEANFQSVASDIDQECYAQYLADDFILLPPATDKNLWDVLDDKIREKKINIVIPSLDETLLEWAYRRKMYKKNGVDVIVSDASTVQICQDKWLTYLFFKEHNIPTPATSLNQEYELVKPRNGRGSKGIRYTKEIINMQGMISQEYIEGTEYTVDVLCDKNNEPIYIVPRIRLQVKEGKSTAGQVVQHPEIVKWVKKICNLVPFRGPINIQCIENKEGELKFLEINPRIGGGMALSFAATENWISVIVDHFVFGKKISPKPVRYGLKMKRYYNEVFYC